jgi:hypothetical protein
MSRPTITEIKSRADIREVWAALGGGKLRGNRGQAFWRGGTHLSVALYPQTGSWHDFVTDDGGDVVELVRTVRRCGFREAVEWLADFTGMSVSNPAYRDRDREVDTTWHSDLRSARWWAISTALLAEWVLEILPSCHPERRGLTRLLSRIRLGDSSLVSEYRSWRQCEPLLTTALGRAGRRSDARVQKKVMAWLGSYLNERSRA